MKADQIIEHGQQKGIDVSRGRSLVAVSNNSGYNISSYPDFTQAEKHALGAGDAFGQCEPMPII